MHSSLNALVIECTRPRDVHDDTSLASCSVVFVVVVAIGPIPTDHAEGSDSPSGASGVNRFASAAMVVTSSAGSIGFARWI
jgi:hypothetical protein